LLKYILVKHCASALFKGIEKKIMFCFCSYQSSLCTSNI